MGSIYNLRSMPSELLVIDDQEYLITKKLSSSQIADLIIQNSSSVNFY
jgi:hypothetical protein